MERLLLSTKVGIPSQPRNLIHRDRLTSTLEEEVPHHRLTLVSCPAGFGKTSLLVDWAHRSRLGIGWFTVESGDLDTSWFLRMSPQHLQLAGCDMLHAGT